MAITFPTRDQIRASIRSIWQSVRPDADDTTYSDLWLYSRIASAVVFRLHQTIQRALNAVFPTSSYGEYLDNWLNWIGAPDGSGAFGRIVARGSSASEALTVTATGATNPGDLLNAQLTDTAGRFYEITEDYVFVGAGTHDVDLAAVTTGAATNLESGDTLTFVSPPANVNSTATLAKDLDGGADDETDAEGRARLLSLLRNPPASGNVADWVSTVENVSPGNLRAYVWPQRQSYDETLSIPGYGMTDYAALQIKESDTDRFIAAADDIYTDIDEAVDAQMPALIYRNSRQLTVVQDPIDFDIRYTLSDGATNDQKCDWDSETGAPLTVIAHDNGGPEIQASAVVAAASRTNGLVDGDIVVIDGFYATVTNVGVLGGKVTDDLFDVDWWPWASGAGVLVGRVICAGGGLVGHLAQTDASGNDIEGEGVYQTIQDYADSMGPATTLTGGTNTAAVSEIPGWDDTARVQGIQSDIIQANDGAIIDVEVDLDGVVDTDYTPTDPGTSNNLCVIIDEVTVNQVYV